MEPARIIKPHSEKEVRLARFLAIVFFPVGLAFVIFGISIIPYAFGGSVWLIGPGILLCVGPIIICRRWDAVLKVFRKSNGIADATVIERKRRKVRAGFSGSGGSGEGAIIEIGIYLVIRTLELVGLRDAMYRYVGHNLIIEFQAASVDHGGKKTLLELPVSQVEYSSHPPGTVAAIRYALEEPSIALIEEEYDSRFGAP